MLNVSRILVFVLIAAFMGTSAAIAQNAPPPGQPATSSQPKQQNKKGKCKQKGCPKQKEKKAAKQQQSGGRRRKAKRRRNNRYRVRMTPLDLRNVPPRGVRERLLGFYFLARTIDKLRAELPGAAWAPTSITTRD